MQNLPYSSSSLSTVEFIFGGSLLRTINEGDTIWFVAKDVCDALELSDVSMSVARLDDDEKGTRKVCTLGGEQSLLCVNESGLYALILRSNKPQAKPFRKWITNEVLPTIRKTGSYGNSPTLPTVIAEAALSSHQKVILLTLAYHANAKGKIQISFSKLAHLCSITKSSTIHNIKKLTAAGFLTLRKTQQDDGGAGTNIYTVPKQFRVHAIGSTSRLNKVKSILN